MQQPFRSSLLHLVSAEWLQVTLISLPQGKIFIFFPPEIREEDQEPYELVFTACQMHLIACLLQ